jgi:hypothetical protein
MSLEVRDSWNNDRTLSLYMETNNIVGYSEVNLDIKYGWNRMRLDSIQLFSLKDTTGIAWDVKPPSSLHSMWSPCFQSLFDNSTTPPREMSGADSLKWYTSKKAWDFSDSYDRRVGLVRNYSLTVSKELLEIMQKDYSMLERFPEYYK